MRVNPDWIKRISMHDFAQIGNFIYFFAMNFNGLYRMYIPDRKLEFLGFAPGEEIYTVHLYGAAAFNNGKLYLPPMNGAEIAVYDIEKDKFKKIPLKYKAPDMQSKFYGAVSWEDKVIFIPARYPYLLILDTMNDEVTYLDHWLKALDIPNGFKGLYVKNGYFIKDRKLYMASEMENKLIKISVDTYEMEHKTIGNGKSGFMDMYPDEDGNIWFVQRDMPEIIKWNEEADEYSIYNNYPDDFERTGIPFINIVGNKDKLCFAAYQANMSLELNRADGVINKADWDKDREKCNFFSWNAKHYFAKELNPSMWLFSNMNDNSFYLVDKNGRAEVFYLEDIEAGDRLLRYQNRLRDENSRYKVSDFIKLVKSR